MREYESTDSPWHCHVIIPMAEPNVSSVAMYLLSRKGLPHVECTTHSGSAANRPTSNQTWSPMLTSILLTYSDHSKAVMPQTALVACKAVYVVQ